MNEQDQINFLQLQYLHLRTLGIISNELTFQAYLEINYTIWPPGTPLPKDDRK